MNEKTAIITGTSSGLGLVMAQSLLNKGYTVFGGSRRESPIEHKNFIDLELDITNEPSVISFFNEVERETEVIDLFINNGGICEFSSFEETESLDITSHFMTNAFGGFLMFKYLEPFLIENETSIINILSLSAKEYYKETLSYTMAEKAKLSLIEVLKKEWEKYQLRFTNLFLGATDTPLWSEYEDTQKEEMLSKHDFQYVFNMIIDAPVSLHLHDLTITHKGNYLS